MADKDKEVGYRDVCLNVEVGWTMESESSSKLEFVEVAKFGAPGIRVHICEVSFVNVCQ